MNTSDRAPSRLPLAGRRAVLAIVAAAFAWLAAPLPGNAADSQQKAFATPEQAVAALVSAARAERTDDLVAILGPGSKDLVFSSDAVADRVGRERFVAAYDAAHNIDRAEEGTASLTIGDDAWPFPIPIVKRGETWLFDTQAGASEILARRIGRNELSVIEVCRAYVDAQREYASKDRNGDGMLEYAQTFRSRPGEQNGLYWRAEAGAEQSPLGPLAAQARAEGYGGKDASGKRRPYHGYFYRILTAQGENAPGGAYSYLADGRMIGGFALLAYPSGYGVSGVMTFIVNQDGEVYQKNLGPDTATIAQEIAAYDPDASWSKAGAEAGLSPSAGAAPK